MNARSNVGEEVNPQDVTAADLVVGVPSYKEEETIAPVVRAIDVGLHRYFEGRRSVIVNVDNASEDATREVFLAIRTRAPKIYVSTPPGVLGKGNNVLNLCTKARQLGARAVVTIDSDLRSIEPMWVLKLANPIFKGFDFVAPIYIRHKYDGTITNNIAYPLFSAAFGHRVRQPIGGEFGLSIDLVDRLLEQPVDVAVRHFGIDIWLSIQACLQDARICQAFMDAPKVHNPKDPGGALDDMFQQVVRALFDSLVAHADAWLPVESTRASTMFGFGLGARRRPEPVVVDTGNLHRRFQAGFEAYKDDIARVLADPQWRALVDQVDADPFDLNFSRRLWARIVYDVLVAYAAETAPRDRVVEILLSLYKGKVLSDILYLTEKGAWVAERHVERQVDRFEKEKPYLVERWRQELEDAA